MLPAFEGSRRAAWRTRSRAGRSLQPSNSISKLRYLKVEADNRKLRSRTEPEGWGIERCTPCRDHRGEEAAGHGAGSVSSQLQQGLSIGIAAVGHDSPVLRGAGGALGVRLALKIAVDETVILLTLSLSITIDTPTKYRGGCSRVTVSPTATLKNTMGQPVCITKERKGTARTWYQVMPESAIGPAAYGRIIALYIGPDACNAC